MILIVFGNMFWCETGAKLREMGAKLRETGAKKNVYHFVPCDSHVFEKLLLLKGHVGRFADCWSGIT